MLRLIMRRGPTPGAVYELTADSYVVGRGSKNDIVIRDNDVSREHCRLTRLMDAYEVQDLQSSTGTYVNGQRVINKFLLQPGSILELGDMITFEYEHSAPAVPAPPPVTVSSETGDPTLFKPGAINPPPESAASPPTPPAPEPLADDMPTQAKAPEEPTEFRASLVMTQGPAAGQVFKLSDLIVMIGRDLSNDIVIQDPEISRRHTRLRRWKHGYSVEDVGSTNGTTVNGHPVTEPRLLAPNDKVKIGTRVQFQYVQEVIRPDAGIPAPKPVPVDVRITKDDTIDLIFDSHPPTRAMSHLSGIELGALSNHIYVAYERSEWESISAPLLLSLQDAGLHVWVDQYLVQGSDEWRAAVEQALHECWLMVLVVSEKSLESPYVRLQYRHFLKRSKPIIPMLYADAKAPTELSKMRAISYDSSNGRKSFHKLVFEIMQTRKQPS
jgi:pSer/pThr/pTyr-binding forkhead associated (FHA) protein